jgi:thiamine pyrophosphate-dependent acetolactate synthase large subunit-like protein
MSERRNVGNRHRFCLPCSAPGYGVPIKQVLPDNGSLGKISREQLAGDLPVWQTSLVNSDFADFARSCGATGIWVGPAADGDNGMRHFVRH